jgi:septum formation protein
MIVLASASPRRAEILTNAGLPFIREVPHNIDETPRPGEAPRDYVMRLAREKAVAIEANEGLVVLGADTTVVVDETTLGKPSDTEDAARMLRLLRGRSHEVITGICLSAARDANPIVDAAVTRVWFAALSDAEVDEYVASEEPRDKAGAYGIQGLASKFVERIDGCYFNVMGLPIALVYKHLRATPAFVL